jgi:diadenylate cyclase
LSDLVRSLQELAVPSWQGFVVLADILLVAFVVYRLLKLVRGTRAWRVALGVGVFAGAYFVSDALEFRTLHWLLDKAALLGPVALAVIFLPELRQAIEGFGNIGGIGEKLIGPSNAMGANTLEEVLAAVGEMAEQRTGALIVLERGNRLDDIAENGVPLSAEVTAALLVAIFQGGSPLHDGAVIVRNDKIVAAACRLPLSENPRLSPQMHMRHRAGVGVSEQTDCVVVIVSEERGQVSLAHDGQIDRMPMASDLRKSLYELMRGSVSVPDQRAKAKGRRTG